MGEMRRGVAHADRPRHADLCQNFGLAHHRVGAGCALVKGQIDQGRGHIFHCRKALIIGPGGQQPVQHVARHRFLGGDVARVLHQHLRHLQPMLEKLAGQFHEITGDGCA